ncbi:hypothetical protein AA12717_0283 [Gluconacetobacter sacchari DSM 12717]|uniref:Uncharacterized protein n=2 Tax=Gluconacetobacter sacchari TaxID=92759 RepID=A0A7W4IAS7_9PROT|nr:hypothetical protein [Gluconacetobacter sacchari]MBB2159368.1 hypothetical protein [Gluconacetobacter sacchari]GBQ19531.1 hypothetical protein AA12717_0283 [Gluconacetobacter sacchari DSM 12717]
MRPYLLAAIFASISIPALAQTQAANPVEPFTAGHRAGVASNPLVVLNVSQAMPVASLPATCTDGALALATDGRTATQNVGAGTGVVVRCLSNKWLSIASGLQVQN